MQMRQPHVALAEGEMTGVEALQRDGLLLLMRNLRPCLDDVYFLISFVEHTYGDGLQLVAHRDDGNGSIALAACLHVVDFQFKILVAVGMLYLQGWCLDGIDGAECWHGREVQVVAGIAQLLQCGSAIAVVSHAQVAAFPGMQQHLCVRGLNGDVAIPCEGRDGQHQKGENCFDCFHFFGCFLLGVFLGVPRVS